MTKRQLNLVFPDGSIVSGATFADLEDALRASQPTAYASRRAFRREMRRRALIWSGTSLPKPILYQTPKAFILHLTHADLCILEVVDPDDQTTPTLDPTDPRQEAL